MLQLEVSGCSQASVGISFVAVTMKLEQVCEKIGDVATSRNVFSLVPGSISTEVFNTPGSVML